MKRADGRADHAVRILPTFGPVVRLRCVNSSCRVFWRFTSTAPPRPVPRGLQPLRLHLDGGDRDAVRCQCGHRLTWVRSQSKPEQRRYLFVCQNPDCPKRSKYQWFELRGSELVRLAPHIVRQDAVRRRKTVLQVPFPRKCPNCSSAGRTVQKVQRQTRGPYWRARCRRCKKSESFTLKGQRIQRHVGPRLADLGFQRPRCQECGKTKKIAPRFRHKVLGALIRFICPQCPPPKSGELWTAKGRPISLEEHQLAWSQAKWRADLPFDRNRIPPCPEPGCGRPLRYHGRLRRGPRSTWPSQPHYFFCPDHLRTPYFYDDRGKPVEVRQYRGRRPSKVFPWGERPKCPKCKTPLFSKGEWEDPKGRLLFRLACENQSCEATLFYFDKRGTRVAEPKRIHRRLRAHHDPPRHGKVWCAACRERPVRYADDRRSKYCASCAALGPGAAWRRQQERRHGPKVLALRRRLSTRQGVKRLRAEAGMTQRELAQRAGISLPLLKKIERGATKISRKSLEALVRVFLASTAARTRSAA